MPASDLKLEKRKITMEGSYSSKPTNFKNARIVDGLSMLTETTVEFFTTNHNLDMQDILGSEVKIIVESAKKEKRKFIGYAMSVEYVGRYQGQSHFVAQLRPWLWFLTLTRENKIFQDMSVLDIIKQILGDRGFSADYENKTSETYCKRPICVQYNESDFDFISRLMEQEGIYYFFRVDGDKLKMVLADSISAHQPTPEYATIKFDFREASYRRNEDHMFDWAENTGATTGKVTLNDYDFESPRASQRESSNLAKGDYDHNKMEHYAYPSGEFMPYGEQSGGDRPSTKQFARVRMEAFAAKHLVSRGAGNVRTIGVGQTFTLKDHPRKANNIKYLVVRCVHSLQMETDYETDETKKPLFDSTIPVDDDNSDAYRAVLDVIPAEEPYRAEQKTPWPSVAGMQTALVVGPGGEEIYTDEYGRIKVQFHWDRVGKKCEKSSCWVRCVMPWTGKNWGMISIPRIGNEVAIQFEEGNPDRPICTGMIYNGDNMPPYELGANMTQTGIVTRSTKSGSANTFHELIFEDKKDKEFVRLQSERDYKEKIKNNAEITIGREHQDPGDLTQTVYHTKTETIETGDDILNVETGNQDVFIKTNQTETIDGKADRTIKLDTTETVTMGNFTQTIDMGNATQKVKMGDISVSADLGKIKLEALQEIKLVVAGMSSITITPTEVKIESLMVNVAGNATVDIGAPMTTVGGDVMLTLDGGITFIN